jgi:hypothetical protein
MRLPGVSNDNGDMIARVFTGALGAALAHLYDEIYPAQPQSANYKGKS